MTASAHRYALYLVPGLDSLLWRTGSAMLGYDAATGERVPQPAFDMILPEAVASMTADPRRYGFHMTIKAPFRLAENSTQEQLAEAVRALALEHPALALGSLRLRFRRSRSADGGFLCLEPREMPDALAALERTAVIALDRFRAPLTPAEIARRSPDRLTLRQRALLDKFGYPFVLDEFRPHFSLTGHISSDNTVLDAVARFFRPALEALPTSRFHLALFTQEDAGAAFRLERFF